MKIRTVSLTTIGASLVLLAALGCASSKFYRVTDPASGNTYYTPKVVKHKKTGTVTFLDPATGVQVILNKPNIKQINRQQFNDGLHKK